MSLTTSTKGIEKFIQDWMTIKEGVAPRIHFADGSSISVQANEMAYCRPRNNEGPWTKFELGFFEQGKSKKARKYAEKIFKDNPDGVAGFVPMKKVVKLAKLAGGVNVTCSVACVHYKGAIR